MLTIVMRTPSGGALVKVEGSFDARDADPLCSIASAVAGRSVTLDFHEARSVSDCAVARLATGLEERHVHASLVGLTEHQHRLLKYFVASQPTDRG